MLLANFLTAISAASIHPQGFLLEPWSELWKEPDPRELVIGKDTLLTYAATTRRANGEAIAVEAGEFTWTPSRGLVEAVTSYMKGADGWSDRTQVFRVSRSDGFPDSTMNSSFLGDGTRIERRSDRRMVGDLELEVASTILSKDGDVRRSADTSWLRRDSQGRLVALGQSLGSNLYFYDTIMWGEKHPDKWVQQSGSLVKTSIEHHPFWEGGNLVKDSAIFSRGDLHQTQDWKFTRVMECEWSGDLLRSCRQTNATDSVPDSVVVHRGEDGRPVEMWQSLHWMAGAGGTRVHARWSEGRPVSLRIIGGPRSGLYVDSLIYSDAGLLDTILSAQCELDEIDGTCPDSLVTRKAFDWNPASIGVKGKLQKPIPRIRLEGGRMRVESMGGAADRLRLRDGAGKVLAETTGNEIRIPAIRGILLWELRRPTGELLHSGTLPAL